MLWHHRWWLTAAESPPQLTQLLINDDSDIASSQKLSNSICGIWQRMKNMKAIFSTGETIMHFWCGWRRVKSSGDTCILRCQLASHLSITATKRLRQLGSTECETQYIPFYILNCLWNKRSFLKSFYSNLQELLIWPFERVFYEHVNMLSTRRYANTKKWSIPPSAMTMAQTECSNHSNN